MTRVWQWNRPVTVREVLEDLHKERSIAYTTVMTVLDNLHQKGWVRREVVGRAYRYTAVSTRAAYSAALMNEAWAQSDNPAAALVAFFGMMSPEQREALNDAIRIVQRDPQEEAPEGSVPARSEVQGEGAAQEPPQPGGNGGGSSSEGKPRDGREGGPEAATEGEPEEPAEELREDAGEQGAPEQPEHGGVRGKEPGGERNAPEQRGRASAGRGVAHDHGAEPGQEEPSQADEPGLGGEPDRAVGTAEPARPPAAPHQGPEDSGGPEGPGGSDGTGEAAGSGSGGGR